MSRMTVPMPGHLGGARYAQAYFSRLLAAFHVGTVRLCHGVLGFMHEVSRDYDGSGPVELVALSGKHAAHHTSGHGTDDPTSGHFSAACFAIVLSLVGVAVLGLLLGALRRHRATVSVPRRSCFVPAFTHLPRGPTLTLLQAYRL